MVHFDDKKSQAQVAELRLREEASLVQNMAKKLGMPFVDLGAITINNAAVGILKETVAREVEAGVFQKNRNGLDVAVFSPNRKETLDVIEELKSAGYTVTLHMATHAGLERLWDRYKDISHATKSTAGVVDIGKASFDEITKKITSIVVAQELINSSMGTEDAQNVSKGLEVILAGAIALNISDIHIEGQDGGARLRYRLDGILQDIAGISPKMYKLLLARIKLLSGLKLNIQADTQDGRFSVKLEGVEIEIRTSVLPGSYGENIVLRILNPKSIAVPFEELGIRKKLLAVVEKEISKPNGMILTTGPTGSGKTTSLYAFLRKIYNPELKIITIEDPVEYHIKGISQTQVDIKSNYTFISGLRAALRQDPDVIMIGEIRDSETAKIAINSALTGHLVLSTLHTNNAAGAIPRLLDLGVNPKVVAPALNASMAQRLVRILCNECKKSYTPEETERTILEKIVPEIESKIGEPLSLDTLWRAPGCSACNNTGFKGRIGIYELILIDEQITKLITQNPGESEIKQAARQQKIPDMREDGIIKALEGITSLEELGRVIDLEENII